MKKPFRVTIRKKKDGRQRASVVFNNPTTGERGRVVSSSSVLKSLVQLMAAMEGGRGKLEALPREG